MDGATPKQGDPSALVPTAADVSERILTSPLTVSAGLGTDSTVLVRTCVALAFLCTDTAGLIIGARFA